MGSIFVAVFLLCFCLFSLQEVSSRVCGHDITLTGFHYTQANGQWQYNGNNMFKKNGPVLYIWQPTGYNAWVIGSDPTVIGVGGSRGHFGWCGKTDVRDCDAGDWWYWNSGWFNDGDAAMLHSKASLSGMTFRREFNGYWDFTGYTSGTEVYSRVESGKTWYLYPIDGAWAIGYALPTNPVSYEPIARCSERDLLRCWEGTWSYVRTGAGDNAAKMTCSSPV